MVLFFYLNLGRRMMDDRLVFIYLYKKTDLYLKINLFNLRNKVKSFYIKRALKKQRDVFFQINKINSKKILKKD